jgi:alpha-galactosidase
MKTSKLLCLLFSSMFVFLANPSRSTGQVGQTPPMGWNSWNHYGVTITDAIVRAQAQAMVTSGMQAAGYTYVNIDDGWQGQRDSQGNIHGNANFPDMKGLADYVHSLGLKIGIYSSPGPKTCGGNVGSFGHEDQDAKTFASWGYDYLKYDWCSCDYGKKVCGTQQQAYQKMYDALKGTKRVFFYNIADVGVGKPWTWAASVGGNSWRTGPDVMDDYFYMAEEGLGNNGLQSFAGPGHWNDPDMLEVGNGGMTDAQYQTEMSLWVVLAAPLIAGNDLTTMGSDIIALLANSEVIAVDQDSKGVQGSRVWQQGPQEIWVKPLADGSKAVAIFNRVKDPSTIPLPFKQIGVTGSVDARDLWLHKDLGLIQDGYKVTPVGYGAMLLKLTPKK